MTVPCVVYTWQGSRIFATKVVKAGQATVNHQSETSSFIRTFIMVFKMKFIAWQISQVLATPTPSFLLFICLVFGQNVARMRKMRSNELSLQLPSCHYVFFSFKFLTSLCSFSKCISQWPAISILGKGCSHSLKNHILSNNFVPILVLFSAKTKPKKWKYPLWKEYLKSVVLIAEKSYAWPYSSKVTNCRPIKKKKVLDLNLGKSLRLSNEAVS